jgi:diamine N-acetyltransferase
MEIALIPISRENWRSIRALELKPEQAAFVTPPVLTFARCMMKVFGDAFEHLPHFIVRDDVVVGYATFACNPTSTHDYWLDDIAIDHRHQGRGYGRAAMLQVIGLVLERWPQAQGIRLTCFRDNHSAAALYLSLGFHPTGLLDDEFGEPTYELSGAALEKYRH